MNINLIVIIFYSIIQGIKQKGSDFILEVFVRNRGADFEFFVFTDNEIKYKTKNAYNIDSQIKTLYHSLNNGTIILDGVHITVDNVSKEQIECISNIIKLYEEKYRIFKENYKLIFAKYSFESSMDDIVTRTTSIEIPNPQKFKEWTYIKGFEYLQYFLNEYEKQNGKEIKVRKKLISFFK